MHQPQPTPPSSGWAVIRAGLLLPLELYLRPDSFRRRVTALSLELPEDFSLWQARRSWREPAFRRGIGHLLRTALIALVWALAAFPIAGMFQLAGLEVAWFGVGVGVAVSVAVSVGVGVAVGRARGVAEGVAVDVAEGVAVGVAMGVAMGVGGGVAGGVGVGVAGVVAVGVAWVVAGVVAGVVGVGVAGGVAGVVAG
ncbi:hypothetical protein EYB53_016535, partial [Candidatus Chloroploca sp. M-50]